ncbi:MAG: Bcr/CflA family efflux MFS transporter [Rhodobacteraceae bacterium]|nr:Bcr/CflA family efflux MFS transporter [Paracoccaceae bacterium]
MSRPDGRRPHFTTLVLLTALSVLSLNMYLPMLAEIATELDADYALANLSIAGYLAITGVLQLIMGPFSDRFGRRPLILIGLGLFLAGSVTAALATSVWVFLFARVLQAGVITGFTLSRAVVRDIAPPDQAAIMLGHIGAAMAIAPMLGPMAGGFLGEIFGWRAIFWFFTFVSLGLMIWCQRDMVETNTAPSATFAAQFREYPALFKSRRFWGYSLCLTFSTGSFYCFITAAPLVLSAEFGLGPAELGLFMGVITVGFFAGNLLSGHLVKRYDLTVVMLAGRLLTVICVGFGTVLFLLGLGNLTFLIFSVISVGLGNGLSIPPGNAGVMSVRPRLAGSASGISGAMTVGGGAILTGLAGLLLNEDSGSIALLLLLLGVVSAAALSAWYVRRVDLQEGPPVSDA